MNPQNPICDWKYEVVVNRHELGLLLDLVPMPQPHLDVWELEAYASIRKAHDAAVDLVAEAESGAQ